jgi:hypothetical protein
LSIVSLLDGFLLALSPVAGIRRGRFIARFCTHGLHRKRPVVTPSLFASTLQPAHREPRDRRQCLLWDREYRTDVDLAQNTVVVAERRVPAT